MGKSIFFIIILIFPFCLFGQSDVDALRYSFLQAGGTARGMALGGAFGAVGADFTSLSSNPAGVGVYRSSNFMITPAFSFNNANSTFSGNSTNTLRPRLNFYNIGFVFAGKGKNNHVKNNKQRVIHNNWKGLKFGLGVNRLAHFNQKTTFSGTTRGTITEQYLQRANGILPENLNDFDTGLAYDANLIFNSDLNPTVYGADLTATDNVFKQHTLTSKGGIDGLEAILGTNYKHKLYLGGGIGVQFISYEEETVYQEEDRNNVDSIFNNLELTNNFTTTGFGVNVKLGAIYRVSKEFRAGIAFHSPTTLTLTDTFNTRLEATLNYPDINSPTTYTAEPPTVGVYNYRIVTPMRTVLSAAFFIKKKGFISAEAEWVNYGSARLRLQDPDLAFEQFANSEVVRKYGHAFNFRGGMEYVFQKFRGRVGYAYYMSPFKVDIPNIRSDRQQITAGLGYYLKRIFFDVAFVREATQALYVPYSPDVSPNTQVATNKFSKYHFVTTVAFKFGD